MKKKFYITTPIYYVNDRPHIGHLYSTVAADILARYHRMLGEPVLFVTGTDDNAQKNKEAAEKTGKPVAEYVREMSALWEQTWDTLQISNDVFIRTSEAEHVLAVEKFFAAAVASGDIYKGTYEGFYCVGCEAFKTESELVDGECPLHNRVPGRVQEENYFFRASKYREQILAHVTKHPEFIEPESRRNEVLNFIKDHLEDFSISRKNNGWGIPVPDDDAHTLYVWFDALINYVTVAGYARDEKEFAKWWPADLHLVGKDLIKFHCAYWPAMLLSAGLALPKKVFAHGFFTIDGQKISKSLGNAIDPVPLAQKYGLDPVRWYLFREIPFGEDGDFSLTRLEERYNAELANGIGNLVARVLGMVEQSTGGKTPDRAENPFVNFWGRYEEQMAENRMDLALAVVFERLGELDKFVDTNKPWELKKKGETEKLEQVLYVLLEQLRQIALALLPFIPDTAESIFERLGIASTERKKSFADAKQWGGLPPGTVVFKGVALFPKLE